MTTHARQLRVSDTETKTKKEIITMNNNFFGFASNTFSNFVSYASPRDTHGPVVKTGPTAGQNRSRNKDGQWRRKRSDAGQSRK